MRKLSDIFASIIASIAYRIESFLDHYNGPKYRAVIQDYDNFLRNEIKHTEHQGSYEEARNELWDEMSAMGLKIWD